MSLSINSNTSALLALLGTSKAVKEATEAMEKLSTGKRINSAKDDAAGVAISSRLDSTVRGLNQSTRNALDAQALLNTAEGGMQETEAVLQRLRELSVQAVKFVLKNRFSQGVSSTTSSNILESILQNRYIIEALITDRGFVRLSH